MRFVSICIVAIAILAARPALGAVHGLVIGIDDYPFHQQLGGAENDARDMAAVLKKIVTGELRVMINAEASRSAFDKAWDDVLTATKPDDVIILHFAGHGIKDTDDEAYKDEADGFDEFFLFHSFSETGPNAKEKIRDDELYFLFKAAEARKVNIVFIADACHSGGLVREVGSLGAKKRKGPRKRFTRFQTKVARPAPVTPAFKPQPELPNNVVFLGATHEARPVEEVYIDERPRGVLTYYAARALEGLADKDSNGTLTAGEMIGYLQPNVQERSRNRQVPILIAADRGLAILSKQNVTAAPPPDVAASDRKDITLAIEGESQPLSIKRARIIENQHAAELIWNAATRELSNASGDVLASGVGPAGLQAAVDARRLRAYLLGLMKNGHVLEVALLPGNTLYAKGCPVEYRVNQFDYPHFTVINLASNGTAQFLFPLEQYNDPIKWTTAGGWNVRTRVSSPFGADFLIFIASEKPLKAMHRELAHLNATQNPLKLETVLRRWLKTTRFQIGLKGAFTSARSQTCGS